MDVQALIPTADPIALPAPFWVFKLLLVVTFLLHILAMNFMLGGGVLAAFARWRGRQDENARRLFEEVSKNIPSLLAATITLGIAPLLFLQVLYGQFFYTSSVIVGWPWFLVIVFVTLAYYGFYLVAFKHQAAHRHAGGIIVFSLLLIVTVGFTYTNNLTLALTPEKWAAQYHANPSGWNLNWSEPTLIPRFLHFMVAAVAIGGLYIAGLGLLRWKKDAAYGRYLIRYGGRWFMYTTMVQFIVGLWFLISQPRSQMMLFMGDNVLATAAFFIGLLAALAAVFVTSEALRKEDPRPGLYLVTGLMFGVIVFMLIMREILQDSYLAAHFNAANFSVATQWEVLPLFLALFLAGVGLWGVMMKRYFATAKAQTPK